MNKPVDIPTIVPIPETMIRDLNRRVPYLRQTAEEKTQWEKEQLKYIGGHRDSLPPGSVFPQGIVYQADDIEVLRTHLNLLQEKVAIVGGDQHPSVFGVSLDDNSGRAIIYWTSSSENDVRSAIPMVNNALSTANMPLIPKLDEPDVIVPHEMPTLTGDVVQKKIQAESFLMKNPKIVGKLLGGKFKWKGK